MSVIARHLTKEVLIASLFVLFALTALFAFFEFVRQLGRIGTRYDLIHGLIFTALNLPTRIYEVMPRGSTCGRGLHVEPLGRNE